MKIGEVREKIKDKNEDELRKLVCEMYKSIPKAVREEKQIDALFDQSPATPEKAAKKAPKLDLDLLKKEIDEFISDAYNQYYFAPNRKISKKNRPKWRFIVKDYYKKLSQIPPETEDGRIAAGLLKDLYDLICYACSYYLFNTQDAFASIMIEQPAFYRTVVRQYLGGGQTAEDFKILVSLLAPKGLGTEYVAQDMYPVLFSETDPTNRELLLQVALEVQQNKLDALSGKKKGYSFSTQDYERSSAANDITGFLAYLYCALGRPDDAAENMFRFDRERNKEIVLYKLLTYYISSDKNPEEWVRQYERALKQGISPRESLQEKYHRLTQQG